jgi:hypothetical protein
VGNVAAFLSCSCSLLANHITTLVPALQHLSLPGCRLTPHSLTHLANHPGLTWLDLSETRMDGTHASEGLVVQEPPYLPEAEEGLSTGLKLWPGLERLSLRELRASRRQGRVEAFDRFISEGGGGQGAVATPAFPRLRTLLLRASVCASACLAYLPYEAPVDSEGGSGGAYIRPLSRLDVRGTGVSASHVLVQLLPHTPCLGRLSIDPMADEGGLQGIQTKGPPGLTVDH